MQPWLVITLNCAAAICRTWKRCRLYGWPLAAAAAAAVRHPLRAAASRCTPRARHLYTPCACQVQGFGNDETAYPIISCCDICASDHADRMAMFTTGPDGGSGFGRRGSRGTTGGPTTQANGIGSAATQATQSGPASQATLGFSQVCCIPALCHSMSSPLDNDVVRPCMLRSAVFK